MIKLDVSALIFLYILFSGISILIGWLILGYRGMKRFEPKEIDYIRKCSVCSHIYIDSYHEAMSVCPLCGRYNKKDGEVVR